jgi:hypothetical protein
MPIFRWSSMARASMALAALAGWSAAAAAEELDSPLSADTAWAALREGHPILALRPRYASVDQDGRSDYAHWGSLRTQLGWESLSWSGFKVVGEGIDVRRFADQGYLEYKDTPAYRQPAWPGWNAFGGFPGYNQSYYPLVADPEITDVNRAYLEYGGHDTVVRAGRQAIRLDNQRFVGDYDFGQLPQLFNAVTVENRTLPGIRVFYGYIARVRNPYGVQLGSSTNLVNLWYEPWDALKLAGFAYFQNQAKTGSVTGYADNSNRIIGGRAWGSLPLGSQLKLRYTAELAEQRSFAGGNPDIDAPYRRLGAGLFARQWFVRADWERLGSPKGLYGFQTPLGSTAMFTGRVDIFASTPGFGLIDRRAGAGATFGPASFRLDYHNFRTDYRGLDLGWEWDAGVTWNITRSLSFSVDYGDYRAGEPGTGTLDTRKVWATLSYALQQR